MTNNSKDISDVFSIFHDGTPENWFLKNNNLSLRISCLYLAAKVSPNYEYFHINIEGITIFKYLPWCLDNTPIEITDLNELNKCDFEISSANLEGSLVKIICHEYSQLYDSPGGDFIVKGGKARITDEEGKPITLGELKQISKDYWNGFGK
jgi:hypothetical protein